MARNYRGVTGKQYKKIFTGMKKCPPSVLQVSRNAIVDKIKAKRYAEMKKVKPNESMETWAKRMRRYSLMTEEAIQKKLEVKKYKFVTKVKLKEHDRKVQKRNNGIVIVKFSEKEHDFLKYYGIIMNYYSVKYGIRKVDLEVCFAFFNNKVIDIHRFNNICVLNTGNSNGMLSRFKKNGYIYELINRREFETKEAKKVRTNTYKLSLSMTKLITNFYEKIAKLNTLNKHQYKGMYSPECEKEIIAMNEEINDYITANKQQLNINQIE